MSQLPLELDVVALVGVALGTTNATNSSSNSGGSGGAKQGDPSPQQQKQEAGDPPSRTSEWSGVRRRAGARRLDLRPMACA